MRVEILHKLSNDILASVDLPEKEGSGDSGQRLGAAIRLYARLGRPLINADLHGLSCPGADLRGQRFIGCKLDGADLRGALLHGADFTSASLTNARLDDSVLTGARFLKADLTNATLRRAHL